MLGGAGGALPAVDFLAGAGIGCSADFLRPRNGSIDRRDLDVIGLSGCEAADEVGSTAMLFDVWRDPWAERKRSVRSDALVRERWFELVPAILGRAPVLLTCIHP